MKYVSDFSGPCIFGVFPGGLMNTSDDISLRHKLAQLRGQEQHRDLDEAIIALESSVERDQLRLTRLKKRKLSLKDKIARLEDGFSQISSRNPSEGPSGKTWAIRRGSVALLPAGAIS